MPEELSPGAAAAVWLNEAVDAEARPIELKGALVKEREKLDVMIGASEERGVPAGKAATLRSILKNLRESIDSALRLLDDDPAAAPTPLPNDGLAQPAPTFMAAERPEPGSDDKAAAGERVIEGVFDGEGMVGDDGKTYLVPPNYASKSKLVEGDLLKLTIGPRGNFIFKQIGPIERQRIIGSISYDQNSSHYLVLAGGKSWKVLKASITYFKAEVADEAVILVPKHAPSKWAAVENVIKRSPQQTLHVER